MGATNSTTHYGLPQFVGTDKPAWLVDFNGSMASIDSAIYNAESKADTAQQAVDTADTNIQAMQASLQALQSSVASLTTVVSSNTGSINTITSLIGNGEPTTTDKTIIGAINEIYDDIGHGDGIQAEEVTYSNTVSGLTADDVQGAIDEVVSMIPSAPTEHGIYELWKNSDITQAFTPQSITIQNFDTNRYDAIWIAVENSANESAGASLHQFDRDVLSISGFNGTLAYMTVNSSGKMQRNLRGVSFSVSGTTLTVTFAKGVANVYQTYGSSPDANDSNSVLIPVRILGLVHNS